MSIDPFNDAVRCAIQERDFQEAFSLYEVELAKTEGSRRIQVAAEFAFLLRECYELERADALFLELATCPDVDRLTLQQIAKGYFERGKFDAAAMIMQRAVMEAEDDPVVWTQLASCLERSHQIPKAIEAAERALKLDPANAVAVRHLARIDRRQGEYDRAVERLEKCLAMHPPTDAWQARYELAANYDRLGDYSKAWLNLLAAKDELRAGRENDLRLSYAIRHRQGELTKAITDSDLKRWRHTSFGQPVDIVLLAGFPRSGTTLLESILTSHDEVVGTDESGILNSQFIRPIVWEATDHLDALLEIRGFENEQLEGGRNEYFKLTSAIIGQPLEAKLLIEKDPLLTCDLPLPLRLFPEAKIIFPLRDPRDVVLSYFFTMVPFGWNSSPAIDIVESARFYHDLMRHWLWFRNRLEWPWLETRYEDLVGDPQSEISRITDFLDLEFTDSMLDPANRNSSVLISTPSYDDVSKPINSQRVSRWQNYQTYMEPAMDILEPWAKELGYA